MEEHHDPRPLRCFCSLDRVGLRRRPGCALRHPGRRRARWRARDVRARRQRAHQPARRSGGGVPAVRRPGHGRGAGAYGQFDVPGWRFTGVDPSDAMLAVARQRLATEGLLSRTHLHVGELHSLPPGPPFDGAQMLGVLHHVPETERLGLLREVTRRLKPGAPLVVGCRVGMDPALWDVELRRWRTHGIPQEELEHRRQGLRTMRFIESDAALFELFAQTGLMTPRPIFVSLQFKVFLVRWEPGAAG
ncbi:class I SAM-dependent methyltransferase [Nannocystis pusilla]|uniref:Class I SAM-dependent methyltransferase n=1 Tax=Nannocystis pusilla TaxID=889268 RepID=A0A9X3EHT8_9BACT|nr:class I SAM-dependent methyltransferase [Nannocystis pusilla]MCY1004297.1 class I SAM-dependent methyltransferase [Nannocystis pusilla]